MKAILITNPEIAFAKPIETWISQSMSMRSHNRKEKGNKANSLKVISSQAGFDKEQFLTFFSVESDTNFVFIVPELNWPGSEDDAFNAGYKVALRLMTDILGDRFFNLVFVSSLKRYQLSRVVAAKYREFINSCPHYWLDDLHQTAMTPIYSRIHFELIRRVLTSKTGRIDYIKHSLNSLGAMPLAEAKDEIRHILDMLSMDVYSRVLPDSEMMIAQLRSQLDGIKGVEEIAFVKDGLDDLTTRLQDGLVSEDGKISRKKSRFSVLIIEDNPDYRKKLEDFFASRFLKVVAYNDAQLKKAIVRRDQQPSYRREAHKDESLINKEVGKFNLIILDLMYKESDEGVKKWLDFDGFDIYKAIRDGEGRRKSVRKAEIRIVTSLPRNEVSILSGKYLEKVETPKVFTKGKDWNQLQACLIDRMDEILEECEKREKDYRPRPEIPKMNGIFKHGAIVEAIMEDDAAYQAAVATAKKVVGGNDGEKLDEENLTLVHPTKTKASTCDPEKFIKNNLVATLIYRRLIIAYAVRHGAFTETELHTYLHRYISGDLPSLDKTFINSQLGFSAEWGTVEDKDTFSEVATCRLKLNNLFEEEKDLLDYDEELTGEVKTWASKLLALFSDPCDDEDGCILRLSDIYDRPVCDLIDCVRCDGGSTIMFKAFMSFLNQTFDFVGNGSLSSADRQYIQDAFLEPEVSLEESDNVLIAKFIRKQYPTINDILFQIAERSI